MIKPKQNTIIIIDDDKGITDVVRIILEEKGYRTICVTESDQFQTVFETAKPDMILLDLWMEGLDGLQITRQIKKSPETARIPIIIISATKDGEQKAREAGADDFLAKPFDILTF